MLLDVVNTPADKRTTFSNAVNQGHGLCSRVDRFLKVKVFLPAGQSLHTEEPVTFEYFPAMRMQQIQHRYPSLSPSPPPTEPNRVLGLRVRDEV